MGFWQRLLSIHTDGEATFRTFDGTMRGVMPWIWILLVMVPVTLAVVAIYWREAEKMSNRRRIQLASLRIIAAFVVCLFVFRPFNLIAIFEGKRPRNVVVLVDNTQSMLREDERKTPEDVLRVAVAKNLIPPNAKLNDKTLQAKITSDMNRSPQRLELVHDTFTHPKLALNQTLTKIGPVQRYVFGQQIKRLPESAKLDVGSKKTLSGVEARTGLADSLHALLLEGDVDLPTAVFVVTDGCDNASSRDLHHVAEEYRKLGVPLHVYGVGSSQGGALKLVEAKVPDVIFAGDTVGIPLRWKANGLKGEKARISLYLGGKKVAAKEIDVEDGTDLRETVTFVPEGEKDKQKLEQLQVKIEIIDRPEIKDTLSRQVRVVDSKVKVLFVEGQPRWEYKFIQRALMRDKKVRAKFLLTGADLETLVSGDPYIKEFPKSRKELFEYDLVFLGDVKATVLRGERMQWLTEFVQEGGGLVHLAGPIHAPAEFVGTTLADLLPVKLRPHRFAQSTEARTTGYQPQLSRYGRRSELLALDDFHEKNLEIWDGLPNLYWHYPVDQLKGGAISLLGHSDKTIDGEPMPLLALHRYGKGQVLFVGFAETWRWRFNEGEKYHDRFWMQITYQLGLSETAGNRRSQLALDRSQVYLNQQSRLFAHLVDDQYRPLKEESIEIEIQQMDGPEEKRTTLRKQLQMVPGVEGEYQVMLANDKGGRFEVRAKGMPDVKFEYQVDVPPNHEMATLGLDEIALKDAAKTSGGAFYREEDLYRLRAQIKPRMKKFEVKPAVPLLNPLTFLLFLCIVTTEWVLRKFSNLS